MLTAENYRNKIVKQLEKTYCKFDHSIQSGYGIYYGVGALSVSIHKDHKFENRIKTLYFRLVGEQLQKYDRKTSTWLPIELSDIN